MTPAHGPMTTLAEREQVRKMRLFSVMMLLSLTAVIPVVVLYSMIVPVVYVIPGWAELGFVLCAIWLNRRGHLTYATLLFFITGEL